MMNVKIRPGGIALFVLACAALIYRLLYTLLWEHENDRGPLLSLFPKKTAVVAPVAAPTASPTAPATVPATAKPLTDWLVLGPIPISDGAPADEAGKITHLIDERQLSDESSLRPRQGETVRVGDADLKWVSVKNRSLDMVAASKSSANKPGVDAFTDAAGYAVATVFVPRTVRNATLYVGSDDGVAIWLNGTKIHRFAAPRGVRLGDDKIGGFTLLEGKNTLVFKVAQGGGTWGLEASLDIPAK